MVACEAFLRSRGGQRDATGSWEVTPDLLVALRASGWKLEEQPLWVVKGMFLKADGDFAGGGWRGIDVQIYISELDVMGCYTRWQRQFVVRIITEHWYPVLRTLPPVEDGSGDSLMDALDQLATMAARWIAERLPEVEIRDDESVRTAHTQIVRLLKNLKLCPVVAGDTVRLDTTVGGSQWE
jgi:hypothetical protein